MSSRHSYLVLHKTEWDRLRRKLTRETDDPQKQQYLRSLNEQSQNWIKLWPDTVQGHVYKLTKQIKVDRDKLLKTVEKFTLKKKDEETNDAIVRAKDMIFADSCYGRQLLSALLESKTLEERDLQIKFQNNLKVQTNEQKIDESKVSSLLGYEQMEINEAAARLRSKQLAKDAAKCNEIMFQMQKEKTRKEIEDKKSELEDKKLLEHQIKENAEIETKKLYLTKQALKDHDMQNKIIKDFRSKKEEQDEKKREIWRKYQERIRSRTKIVLDKIHHEKHNSPQTQKLFKTIQNIKENRNREYDEFIDKGIQRWLDSSKKQKQNEIKYNNSRRLARKLIDEDNKMQATSENQKRLLENNNNVCYKQCILTKCCRAQKQENLTKMKEGTEPSFLLPKNKQLKDLKNRQKEPPPWNALNEAYAQFFQHARNTLQECHYKNPARKVINDYRRINCLEPKSVPKI